MASSSKPTTRPGITTPGRVVTVGNTTTITGWALTTCAPNCGCHIGVGPDGPLKIACDQAKGTLGLRSYTTTGTCTCCAPWTTAELESILTDLTAIQALITTSEPSAETP